MYGVDSSDSKKSAPKQLTFDNSSSIPAFDTDAAAQVDNPTKGTMTYSIASDKIFIYNGTAWKTWTRD
tara:strand:- start:1134 stop:1337 length:204 start_codon:yes stop_codon:yes gene_type:complete